MAASSRAGAPSMAEIKNYTLNFGPLMMLAFGVAALDFFGYWAHRLLHQSWLGWQFHRVHHSEAAVDVTTAFRRHPGETVWGGALGGGRDRAQRAVALEEEMSLPAGPPDTLKPAHELYGDILPRAGRPAEAARVRHGPRAPAQPRPLACRRAKRPPIRALAGAACIGARAIRACWLQAKRFIPGREVVDFSHFDNRFLCNLLAAFCDFRAWPFPLTAASAATKSAPCSARAGWAKSI